MGFDAVALQQYPEVEHINHVHTAGNSSGIVDGDVRSPRLVVQEGAVLNGTVEMGETKPQKKPAVEPAPPKVALGGEAR